MIDEKVRIQTNSSQIESILDEYPLYLRWGQLLELHARLGLGGKKIVQRRIRLKEIKRVYVCGKRAHYVRASVVHSGLAGIA